MSDCVGVIKTCSLMHTDSYYNSEAEMVSFPPDIPRFAVRLEAKPRR